jgi:HAD superfamily hydrolase (TIGR01490 family)
VKEVKESGGGIAAFFDLDGTLVARPSLERRFFRMLRYRGAIPTKNYFLWLKEAARLAPRGRHAMRFENKMYLRGVAIGGVGRWVDRIPFFSAAVDRVAWHAKRGHQIVIVSGTLEMLAREAATQLETELEARGPAGEIYVCATRLEEKEARWTGRIVGEAMFGEAKARAVKRLGAEMGVDLSRSYAYGDSTNDRWLLAAVGRPVAVNASKELLRLTQERDWPTVIWEKRGEKESTQSVQKTQMGSGEREVATSESGV